MLVYVTSWCSVRPALVNRPYYITCSLQTLPTGMVWPWWSRTAIWLVTFYKRFPGTVRTISSCLMRLIQIRLDSIRCSVMIRRCRPLVVSAVVSSLKKIFGIDETNAPRMLYILRNVLLALVETPDSTLLDVQPMLIDPAYRKRVLGYVSDPLVRGFWEEEFARYNDRLRIEAISPIQNKVNQFLTPKL